MSKFIKCLLLILIVVFVIRAGIWAIPIVFNPLEIPELNSESVQYGKIVSNEEIIQNYEIYSQKLEFEDFIDNEINDFIQNEIDSLKAESTNSDTVYGNQKAVYKNVIDTYKVNDELIGIKLTSITKKLYEEEYTTKIYTFNYDLTEQRRIYSKDIFKESYKDVVGDIYGENFLLKDKEIEFYYDLSKETFTYNMLMNVISSKKFTAYNFDINQETYEKLFLNKVDPSKKMVAITLDDGPHSTNTQEILKILEDNNARVTFFMLGENVDRYKDVVKQVYDSGHEIGIHTWNHKQLTKLSKEQIVEEVENTANAVEQITGQRPKLLRPPYGSFNNLVKESVDYPIILWNIDSLDWKSKDEEKIVPLVLNDVQDGDIILLHDIHSTTIPAVKRIVEELKVQDYQLVTVSELLEAKGYDTNTTRVFYSGRQ